MKLTKLFAVLVLAQSALHSTNALANPMCIFHDTIGAGRILRAIISDGVPGIMNNSMDTGKDSVGIYATVYKDFLSRDASNHKCTRSAAYKIDNPPINAVVVSFSYQIRSGENKSTTLVISDGKLVGPVIALAVIQRFREDR